MQNSRDSWFLLKSKPTLSRDVIDRRTAYLLELFYMQTAFCELFNEYHKIFWKNPC